jgi:hypothetical protein
MPRIVVAIAWVPTRMPTIQSDCASILVVEDRRPPCSLPCCDVVQLATCCSTSLVPLTKTAGNHAAQDGASPPTQTDGRGLMKGRSTNDRGGPRLGYRSLGRSFWVIARTFPHPNPFASRCREHSDGGSARVRLVDTTCTGCFSSFTYLSVDRCRARMRGRLNCNRTIRTPERKFKLPIRCIRRLRNQAQQQKCAIKTHSAFRRRIIRPLICMKLSDF